MNCVLMTLIYLISDSNARIIFDILQFFIFFAKMLLGNNKQTAGGIFIFFTRGVASW